MNWSARTSCHDGTKQTVTTERVSSLPVSEEQIFPATPCDKGSAAKAETEPGTVLTSQDLLIQVSIRKTPLYGNN